MSEQDPSGTGAATSGQSEEKVSLESHRKLLGEKKKRDQEVADLKAQLDAIEQEKLEAQGKLKEAYEIQKKQTEEYKSKNVNLIKDVTNKTIRSQFLREAEKLGCIDPELLMKACSFDDIDVDVTTFELDTAKLTEKIQEAAKTKSYLFKKAVNVPPDLNPSNSVAGKSLSQMSDQELTALLEQIKE